MDAKRERILLASQNVDMHQVFSKWALDTLPAKLRTSNLAAVVLLLLSRTTKDLRFKVLQKLQKSKCSILTGYDEATVAMSYDRGDDGKLELNVNALALRDNHRISDVFQDVLEQHLRYFWLAWEQLDGRRHGELVL